MSSLNMCVFVLCFILLAVAEGRVIRTKEFPLPAEGITMEFLVKDKSDMAHPLSTLKIDIDHLVKKITVTQSVNFPKEQDFKRRTHPIVTLEDRFGVKDGKCPSGRVRRLGICVPDDDY